MRDDVTDMAMAGLLKRLTASYGKPFGTTAGAMVAEYAGAFRRAGIPLVAAATAVDEAISCGKRFPPVSELLDRARGHLPQPDHARQETAHTGCRQCGAGHFYAGYEFPNGAVLPKLRCCCAQHDPSWYTEAALAWTEPTPADFPDAVKPRDYATNARYRERPLRRPPGVAGFSRAV